MTTAERYSTAARQLYDQALVELEAGDLRQASEKFWGAAAQAMKALAERKGWHHRSHRHFKQNLDKLQDRKDYEELVRWFGAAELLHINFYEDYSSYKAINIHAEDVSRLIERIEQVE